MKVAIALEIEPLTSKMHILSAGILKNTDTSLILWDIVAITYPYFPPLFCATQICMTKYGLEGVSKQVPDL